MAIANTIYGLGSWADQIAQLFGIGAVTGINPSPTFASSLALGPTIAQSGYVRLLGVSTVSATSTLTTAVVGRTGQLLSVSCEASASGTVTYTFSTGFKVSATAAATAGTAMTVNFRSNGTNWVEVSRSLAITN